MHNNTLTAFCMAAEGMGLKGPQSDAQLNNIVSAIKDPGVSR